MQLVLRIMDYLERRRLLAQADRAQLEALRDQVDDLLKRVNIARDRANAEPMSDDEYNRDNELGSEGRGITSANVHELLPRPLQRKDGFQGDDPPGAA